MSEKFYITTPIYYVNDKPHIGHAYTSLVCDVMSRFAKLDGKDVYFLTGTDEHGQKVQRSAEKVNIDPQIFTDKVSGNFRELSTLMNLTNDDFIRTTQERHKEFATEFWNILKKRGRDEGGIYLDKYAGWYAMRDEAFYAESELINGKAPTGAEVEWVEEPSYFFALSYWQDKLLDFFEKNPNFVYPKSRMNEVINFVKGGLNDLSVSRTSFNWGIKIPDDEKHVMYVWLDALTNYMSALDYFNKNSNLRKYWPADIHVVGKDILRFHAVYWIAFLMAADLPLPQQVLAHGWWTNEGQKISKSVGNIIDPHDLVNEFGVDYLRYFMIREVPLGNDGNYAKEQLISRVNSELANNIGNLCQRTLSMVYKNCFGKIPTIGDFNDNDDKLLFEVYSLHNNLQKLFNERKTHLMLEVITDLSNQANEYITKEEPWALKKTDLRRMNTVLYVLVETIRIIGIALQPFVPASANKILDQLNIDYKHRDFKAMNADFSLKYDHQLQQPSPIFNRIEDDLN